MIDINDYVNKPLLGLTKNKTKLILSFQGLPNIIYEAGITDGGSPKLTLVEEAAPAPIAFPVYWDAKNMGFAYLKQTDNNSGELTLPNGQITKGKYGTKYANENGMKQISPEEALARIERFIIRKGGYTDDTAYLHQKLGKLYKVSVLNVVTESKAPLNEINDRVIDGTYMVVSADSADSVLPLQHRKNKGIYK